MLLSQYTAVFRAGWDAFWTRWNRLSLVQQFAAIAFVVIGCGTAVIGSWMAKRIEEAVVQNSAASAALYMESLVEPIVQSMTPGQNLTTQQIAALDELFSHSLLGKRIIAVKIWTDGGRIAYANNKALIGQTFPVEHSLEQAWQGKISAELDHLDDVENAGERKLGLQILEIYAPLRERGGGRVIAVGEFYDNADDFKHDLQRAYLSSWMVAASAGLAMFATLFGLVLQASRTIDGQRLALTHRVDELQSALRTNQELRQRVDEANRRTVEANDQFLRQVGGELHDGPAQLLALALLRLDALTPLADAARANGSASETVTEVMGTLNKVIGEALGDIRNICTGLSLPEANTKSLSEMLERCAENHERRTETIVARQIDDTPVDLPSAYKICLYRFAQEGLNNAFKHAQGAGQSLRLSVKDKIVEVEVSDSGPGMDMTRINEKSDRMGLTGLRDRISSLGGSFDIHSREGDGFRLIARFDLRNEQKAPL